jgi:hypothetical protein
MSIIAIFPPTRHNGCHVKKFEPKKWGNFLLNTANLTEPSGRMVVGDVAVGAIVAEPVLRWYLP